MMIAGYMPHLAPVPPSSGGALPVRDPADPARQKPAMPALVKVRRQNGGPRKAPVDVYLRYRAPWSCDVSAQNANEWNLDDDAYGPVVLAAVRVTASAPLVPIAVPVSRTRRAGRRIVSAIGTGEEFAIEAFAPDGMPRLRIVLVGAPIDVAQRLRAME